MGVPRRSDRRPHLLRHHHPEPGARSLVGRIRDLAGRAGIWGGIAGRRRRRLVGGAPAVWILRTGRGSWTWSRRGCWSPRRSGGSATTSTRSCSARPRSCRGRWRSRPRIARRAICATRTFEPTFLYELIWNLLIAGAADLARPAPARPRPRPVRAVRRRLLGVPHLRGDPADRLLQLLPGDAGQLLGRAGAVRDSR